MAKGGEVHTNAASHLPHLPWSWPQKAWLSSCISSVQAGLPTRLLSLCCLEGPRCCSGQTRTRKTHLNLHDHLWHRNRYFSAFQNYGILGDLSLSVNVCFSPCNAGRAGIRHCVAMEGRSWRRRCCSGRAWLGDLSHPSVGRNSVKKKGAFHIIHIVKYIRLWWFISHFSGLIGNQMVGFFFLETSLFCTSVRMKTGICELILCDSCQVCSCSVLHVSPYVCFCKWVLMWQHAKAIN